MVGSVLGSKLDLPDALPRGARRIVGHSDVPLGIARTAMEEPFRGAMARARIWSEALAAEQVAALAAGGSKKEVARSPTLVADLAFDSSENGAFACRAGSGLVARPQGEVAVVDAPQGRVIELKGQGLEVTNDPQLDLRRSCSLEVWTQLETTSGRLLDKTPAGTAQGYLLDMYPRTRVRSVIKPGTLRFDAQLKPGAWVHLVSTFNAADGQHRLYVNGKQVISRQESASTPAVGDEALTVSRGYALSRWMSACAGRGSLPMKFNGSLFTVDAQVRDPATTTLVAMNADYCAWGGNYWFQNQRLLYWPMLAAGDFDLMEPWWKMYRDVLPWPATGRGSTTATTAPTFSRRCVSGAPPITQISAGATRERRHETLTFATTGRAASS